MIFPNCLLSSIQLQQKSTTVHIAHSAGSQTPSLDLPPSVQLLQLSIDSPNAVVITGEVTGVTIETNFESFVRVTSPDVLVKDVNVTSAQVKAQLFRIQPKKLGEPDG